MEDVATDKNNTKITIVKTSRIYADNLVAFLLQVARKDNQWSHGLI